MGKIVSSRRRMFIEIVRRIEKKKLVLYYLFRNASGIAQE